MICAFFFFLNFVWGGGIFFCCFIYLVLTETRNSSRRLQGTVVRPQTSVNKQKRARQWAKAQRFHLPFRVVKWPKFKNRSANLAEILFYVNLKERVSKTKTKSVRIMVNGQTVFFLWTFFLIFSCVTWRLGWRIMPPVWEDFSPSCWWWPPWWPASSLLRGLNTLSIWTPRRSSNWIGHLIRKSLHSRFFDFVLTFQSESRLEGVLDCSYTDKTCVETIYINHTQKQLQHCILNVLVPGWDGDTRLRRIWHFPQRTDGRVRHSDWQIHQWKSRIHGWSVFLQLVTLPPFPLTSVPLI